LFPPFFSAGSVKDFRLFFSLFLFVSINGFVTPYFRAFPTLSKNEGNNWRTNCEGTVTRQDEKRTRSVSGPEKFNRDAIPYSAVYEFATWRMSSPSNRFRRSSCLCRSSLSEPVCSLPFHPYFLSFFDTTPALPLLWKNFFLSSLPRADEQKG